jgi:hypothetical protein
MMPGDRGSEILAARSRMQDMQRPGGIGGLLGRFRRPMFPPTGGFGGFGGGGFGLPPFNPFMGGFGPPPFNPFMGGGFFGGFRPRFRRRQRAPMPDFAGQISSLEAKIAELQEQLAARQAAVPTPDPVMAVAEPRIGTLGGTGSGEFPLGTAGPRMPPAINVAGGMVPSNIKLPDIDVEAIRERIANFNIDVGERPDMPGVPRGRPVVSLPPEDVGGRKKLKKGPGGGKILQRPPSISRLPSDMPTPAKPPRTDPVKVPIKMQPLPLPGGERIDLPRIPDEILRDVQSRGTVGSGMVPPPVVKPPRGDVIKVPIKMPPIPMIPAPMPAPVMSDPVPMPSLPQFPMPQIDPMPMPRMPAPMPMPAPVMPAPMQMAPAGRMRGRGGRMR